MANPDYQTLMLPVLTIAAEGESRVPLAAEIIADRFGLTKKRARGNASKLEAAFAA